MFENNELVTFMEQLMMCSLLGVESPRDHGDGLVTFELVGISLALWVDKISTHVSPSLII
jgi:hypothetical protein